MLLIDKSKLLEYLSAIKPDEYFSAYGKAAVDVINHIETYVNALPTIDAQPVRHGQWQYDLPNAIFVCSECRMMYRDNPNYCPRCGADMRGGDAE